MTTGEVMDFSKEFGLASQVIQKDYVLGWLLAGISQHAVFDSQWVNHWLRQSGRGRGTRYQLPNAPQSDLFTGFQAAGSSGHLEASSGHYEGSSGHSSPNSEQTDGKEHEHLRSIAAPVREKGRAPKEFVEQTIEALCSEDWLPLRTLGRLLERDPEALRKHYIGRMVREGKLAPRFPGYPNHPDQAYKTKNENGN